MGCLLLTETMIIRAGKVGHMIKKYHLIINLAVGGTLGGVQGDRHKITTLELRNRLCPRLSVVKYSLILCQYIGQ